MRAIALAPIPNQCELGSFCEGVVVWQKNVLPHIFQVG
jgi:hypothetical protein